MAVEPGRSGVRVSFASDTRPGTAQHELPSDAVAVRNVLRSMGVKEYEPRVVHMLLDFMYQYVSDVLLDAEEYAEDAGKAPGEQVAMVHACTCTEHSPGRAKVELNALQQPDPAVSYHWQGQEGM